MTFSRRNRIISVRVSQDEYEQVERVSRERGAHSVSDFVRWVLTNGGLALTPAEVCSCGIAAQVAALERKVDWLSGLVNQNPQEADPSMPAPGAEDTPFTNPSSVLCEPGAE